MAMRGMRHGHEQGPWTGVKVGGAPLI